MKNVFQTTITELGRETVMSSSGDVGCLCERKQKLGLEVEASWSEYHVLCDNLIFNPAIQNGPTP